MWWVGSGLLTPLFTLSVMFDVSVLELKEDRCSRQDILFIRKVRRQINHVYRLCRLLNALVVPGSVFGTFGLTTAVMQVI